jgi:cell division protein FtsZ
MSNFDFQNDMNDDYKVVLKVIGVGGAGGNVVNTMVDAGINNPFLEYIAINTDVPALRKNKAGIKIQIGKKIAGGRGSGNEPAKGKLAAEENMDEISEVIKDANMVFIAAGMGGGTGTGASPVVAKLAKDAGILTVAFVTKPFSFESPEKMQAAMAGIEELRKHVDSLIVVPNEKLLAESNKKLSFFDAFKIADNVLMDGVKSISDIILETGYINIDFADVRTTMVDSGLAHLVIGRGKGKEKAQEALSSALKSPLLETSITGAKRILVNLTISTDTLLEDIDYVSAEITKITDEKVKTKFGAIFDESLEDEMVVTIVATDFDEPRDVIKVGNPIIDVELANGYEGSPYSYGSVPTQNSSEPRTIDIGAVKKSTDEIAAKATKSITSFGADFDDINKLLFPDGQP